VEINALELRDVSDLEVQNIIKRQRDKETKKQRDEKQISIEASKSLYLPFFSQNCKLPPKKIIVNNRKIKVIKTFRHGKKGKLKKIFIVKIKGSLKTFKATWVLDEHNFWEFMKDYVRLDF